MEKRGNKCTDNICKGLWRNWLAQSAHNRPVLGSIPSRPTINLMVATLCRVATYVQKEKTMSTKNHPNFHAAKFTCDITSSLFESLRGKAFGMKRIPKCTKDKILSFVFEIEKIIDEAVGE